MNGIVLAEIGRKLQVPEQGKSPTLPQILKVQVWVASPRIVLHTIQALKSLSILEVSLKMIPVKAPISNQPVNMAGQHGISRKKATVVRFL